MKPPPRDSLSPSLPVVVIGRHPGPFHIGQAASQRGCQGLTRARKLAVLVGTRKVLATVYGIVKQNDGFINVYSEPGKDTTFKIYLSRHGGGEAGLIDAQDVTEIPGGLGETVLIVEDEESILKMTQMMLERMGYKVLLAGTPGEAIALAREHVGEIHLLMTDVVMPEMNGRDPARNLLSLYPSIKRLFMSGYTANVIAYHGVLDEGVQFIQKPFAKQDLATKVREVLDEDNL